MEHDLAGLSDRITAASVLREHHVWEAAKALSAEVLEPGEERIRRRFAVLMEAHALIDAVLLLMGLAKPGLSVVSFIHGGERWTCTMLYLRDGVERRSTVEHADLAAAVLASLLQSVSQCSSHMSGQ